MLARRPRVLLLRPTSNGLELFRGFAEAYHVPIVRVKAIPGASRRVLELCREGGWLVFTSANGVRVFAVDAGSSGVMELSRLSREGVIRVAAVGPKTAKALEDIGVKVDLVPEEFMGRTLAYKLLEKSASRVILARSMAAIPDLRLVLESHGVEVFEVPLYAVYVDRLSSLIAASLALTMDYIVYTSPSIVDALFKALEELGLRSRLVSVRHVAIGPTTARKLKEYGVEPYYPETYTLEAIAELIKRDWRGG